MVRSELLSRRLLRVMPLLSRLNTVFGILSGWSSFHISGWDLHLLTLFDYSSKLAAGVLGGLDKIFIKPGSKVLYLGAGMVIASLHASSVTDMF